MDVKRGNVYLTVILDSRHPDMRHDIAHLLIMNLISSTFYLTCLLTQKKEGILQTGATLSRLLKEMLDEDQVNVLIGLLSYLSIW